MLKLFKKKSDDAIAENRAAIEASERARAEMEAELKRHSDQMRDLFGSLLPKHEGDA